MEGIAPGWANSHTDAPAQHRQAARDAADAESQAGGPSQLPPSEE
jgi:hypothetical protein